MVKTWQFYALVFLFIGSAQSGLLVIANATPMLNSTGPDSFFHPADWGQPLYEPQPGAGS